MPVCLAQYVRILTKWSGGSGMVVEYLPEIPKRLDP